MALTLGSDKPGFEPRPLQAKPANLSAPEATSESGHAGIPERVYTARSE